MKVAIYKKDGTFTTVIDEIINPRITGTELTFDNGIIHGIDDNHILLDDAVDIPATLAEAIPLDQKANYIVEEVNDEDRIAALEEAMLTVMNMM